MLDAKEAEDYPPLKLRDLAVSERPQERLLEFGASALSDTELLALLLRTGRPGMDVLTLAGHLISQAGSLACLLSWKETDFQRQKGIGRVKAVQLVTVMEIARRVLAGDGTAPQLHRADLVYAYMRPISIGLSVEKFWILCLNRKNRLLKRVEVSSGTATATLVHPREVYREAIREGATAIVCVHNHPSGDPEPSSADLNITRQLREAAKAVDIQLIDHVILGQPSQDPVHSGYFSFRAAGLI